MTQCFPDGTPIGPWFSAADPAPNQPQGRIYPITEHGVRDDGRIYTGALQELIDRIAAQGGGTMVVPAGVYRTGSLFFRQGVHLYVAEGGVLQGSDDPADYALLDTRIEGESCLYFAALINADGLDGFTLSGPGVIDGCGQRSWRAFWLRRRWNPRCTNKDEQRPRLVYLSHCRNVTLSGLTLQNAHFWTTHIYKCQQVRYLHCTIRAEECDVRAPSTDAIDIDACTDVLVQGCRMQVNDDAVVLKGGKGPWADSAPENGPNERILIQDCDFGHCHACLTLGSESVHDRNVVLRNCRAQGTRSLLCLKLRPDTPQLYEYVRVQGITGTVENVLNINPWLQFFDLKGRTDMPLSRVQHIALEDCTLQCDTYFNVTPQPDRYTLSHFELRRLHVTARRNGYAEGIIQHAVAENVTVLTDI